MNTSVANKTMAIKARVYNIIRTDLYKKIIKETTYTKYRKIKALTDKDKLELFEKWFLLNQEAHKELNNYKEKRKYKSKIQKERVARGVKPKRKTSKREYEIMQDIKQYEPRDMNQKINLVDSEKVPIFELQKMI